MIKVLIADDQELIRQSLSIVLNTKEGIEVTDTVANGQEVIASVRKNRPDVILMDIRMPKMDGVQCTKIIKDNYSEIKIIILTTFDDDEYVYNALKWGASGYLLKGVSMDGLTNAIRTVYSGQAMINPDIATKVVRLFENKLNNEGSLFLSPSEKRNIGRVGVKAYYGMLEVYKAYSPYTRNVYGVSFTQNEYIKFMYSENNIGNCEHCPENNGGKGLHPCNQPNCWVSCHCNQ